MTLLGLHLSLWLVELGVSEMAGGCCWFEPQLPTVPADFGWVGARKALTQLILA